MALQVTLSEMLVWPIIAEGMVEMGFFPEWALWMSLYFRGSMLTTSFNQYYSRS